MNQQNQTTQRAELNGQNGSFLFNIAFNVILPSVVLTKLSAPERLGPTWAFVAALAFPLAMGLRELLTQHKPSFFVVFGLLNVALTGGLGLLKLDGFWFAVKEAAFPLILGLGILISMRSPNSIVRGLLLNESVVDIRRINTQLEQSGRQKEFETLVSRSTLLFACSFFLSALLNFVLARVILKSPTGSAEFNAELGRMTALSFPVISVPVLIFTALIFWYLLRGIGKLTGLTTEHILRGNAPRENSQQSQ